MKSTLGSNRPFTFLTGTGRIEGLDLKGLVRIELQSQTQAQISSNRKCKSDQRLSAPLHSSLQVPEKKKKERKEDKLMKPTNQSKSKPRPFTSWRLKPGDNGVSVTCRLSIRLQLLSTQQYYTGIQLSTLRAWISLILLNPNHLWIKHEWL